MIYDVGLYQNQDSILEYVFITLTALRCVSADISEIAGQNFT